MNKSWYARMYFTHTWKGLSELEYKKLKKFKKRKKPLIHMKISV